MDEEQFLEARKKLLSLPAGSAEEMAYIMLLPWVREANGRWTLDILGEKLYRWPLRNTYKWRRRVYYDEEFSLGRFLRNRFNDKYYNVVLKNRKKLLRATANSSQEEQNEEL